MRRTYSVLFFIRRNKVLKTGETNILMRITVNGQNKEDSTHRTIFPKLWDQKKGRATGKNPTCVEINRHLDNLRAKLNSIRDDLEKQNIVITPSLILDSYKNPKQEEPHKMFFEVFEAHNEECEKLIGIDLAKSTVDRYKLCLTYFKEMYKKESASPDIVFDNVTERLIRKFEVFLKTEKGICHNTCIRYLKCVHKITNIAFNNHWIKINPFANIKLQPDKTKVEFLILEEIERIINKEFTIKRLEQVRDVFVFCCYTGLAFIDAWQLTAEYLVKDIEGWVWIRKERQKTKVEFNVPLLEVPLAIIEKYKSDPDCIRKGKLLPVISNQKMNAYLKEIADICGIKKRLTVHVARHTFATTITLANQVTIENVAKMLGHTKLSMTQHYAKILDKSVRRDMQNVSDCIQNELTKITEAESAECNAKEVRIEQKVAALVS